MGEVADAPDAGKILGVALEAAGVKAPAADAIGVGNAIVIKGRVPNVSRVLAGRAGVVAKAVKTRLFKQPRRRNR